MQLWGFVYPSKYEEIMALSRTTNVIQPHRDPHPIFLCRSKYTTHSTCSSTQSTQYSRSQNIYFLLIIFIVIFFTLGLNQHEIIAILYQFTINRLKQDLGSPHQFRSQSENNRIWDPHPQIRLETTPTTTLNQNRLCKSTSS